MEPELREDRVPPRRIVTRSVATALGVAVTLSLTVPAAASAQDGGLPAFPAGTPAAQVCPDGPRWTGYSRPAEFDTVTSSDVPIVMSDGVTLYADVTLPDADGPFPTIVTQTAYSKGILGGAGTFAPRGYAEVVVDLRGTGTSEGGWDPFSERERRDGFEVFEWVVDQEWSDGVTGGYGASYLGLTQIFSASQQPEGLAAIFPVVPVADAYRDIVLMGGLLNVGFMPLWVGLVTAISVAPNTRFATDPAGAAAAVAEHLLRVTERDSTVGLLVDVATGDEDVRFDGPFWQDRSPINHVDTVEVPTFIVGGLNDLFQRGEPLLYEALKDRVPAKLLMGPWGHVDGSSGAGLEDAGLPALEDLALRWFDHHLMGVDTAVDCIPDVTQWHWGPETYRTQPDWPHPDLTPRAFYLGDEGDLTPAPPTVDGADLLPPVPVAGICSRSTSQWLMGVLDRTPCAQDNRVNELLERQWTSAPLEQDLTINGPLAARLWLETVGPEAVVVVRVTDVAPDGTSRELTNGLQAASLSAVDEDRSRIVDGWNLQPWHPFTAASQSPVPTGEAVPVDVEIFSTAAIVPAGRQLRISVGTADVPHAIAPLPDLAASTLSVTQVLHGPDTPSYLVLPSVPAEGTGPIDQPVPTAARAGAPDPAPTSVEPDPGGREDAPSSGSNDPAAAPAPGAPSDRPLPVTGGTSLLGGGLLLLLGAAVRRLTRTGAYG